MWPSRASLRRASALPFTLAALATSCSREPEIEERPVLVYSPRACPVSQAEAYSVIYAGGDFTTVREAGGNRPDQTRNRAMAFDARTGAIDPDFTPDVDKGEVSVMLPAPDGESLYMGGNFGYINGVRTFVLARVDARTGEPITTFQPQLDARVRDLRLAGDRLYVAGTFATAGGEPRQALATLDRVNSVVSYQPSTGVVYPANNALAQALRAVAGAMFRGIGTKVFWVQTGGFDTHATQNTNAQNAGYANLMGNLDTALTAFYTDLRNQQLLQSTMIIVFSEFGRRITENGSNGTDHGAAGLMMMIGGGVQGGIYGTSAQLQPGHHTLENHSADVTWETDFRSVYATVIDNWLGSDSVSILGGNFRNDALTLV